MDKELEFQNKLGLIIEVLKNVSDNNQRKSIMEDLLIETTINYIKKGEQ